MQVDRYDGYVHLSDAFIHSTSAGGSPAGEAVVQKVVGICEETFGWT